MKAIKIGNRIIGDGHPAFIIAEAGINHNGELKQAKKLIKEAKKVGADAIKFQIFKAEEFCSKKSEYYSLFKSLEFKKEEWIEIAEAAKKEKIIFTASVFGKESADLLDELTSPLYKIASGDITNIPLLSYIARKNKPVIISTGASFIGEIEEAINVISSNGNNKIALLHCISTYPAKYEEMNLTAIQTLKNVFRLPVGLSDHTAGIIIPIVAVAMGANIIEKHFTLDKNLPGPDHKLSLSPIEFKEMVKQIRMIEMARGDGMKKPAENEMKIRNAIRRSIAAKVKIAKGSVIERNMLKIVRPCNGIEPKYLSHIIGRRAKEDIEEDEIITWDKIC